MTAVVLVIVLVTKFLAGAWIAILAMGTFFMIMQGIRRHYDNVGRELIVEDDDQVLPTRVHAIVLVSKVHKPTMRALAYAKATRPNVLEAVLRRRRPDGRRPGMLEEWDERRIDVPAEGALLAVPRDHPADRRLRPQHPRRQPARRGRGLHPRVRRRPLVGAAAAQPDRAAAQGPAAVHARA